MSDLLDDLHADLSGSRAAAADPEPRRPALPTAPLSPSTTPAFELRVTPLRWSAPGLGFDGGVCLRIGPLQVGHRPAVAPLRPGSRRPRRASAA